MAGRRPVRTSQVLSSELMVVGPEGATAIVSLVRAVQQRARADGIALGPALRQLLSDATEVAAASGHPVQAGSGPADIRCSTDPAVSDVWIGTRAAGELLGVGQRRASALAAAGAFGLRQRVGPHWRVQQHEVAAYAAERRTA